MPSVDARELFAPLGPSYDSVGAALSFGQDPLWRRFLVSRLPRDGGHVLDVATGTGLVAAELLRRGHRVTGIDQSAGMLARARRRFDGRVELVEASADDLPFADATAGSNAWRSARPMAASRQPCRAERRSSDCGSCLRLASRSGARTPGAR